MDLPKMVRKLRAVCYLPIAAGLLIIALVLDIPLHFLLYPDYAYLTICFLIILVSAIVACLIASVIIMSRIDKEAKKYGVYSDGISRNDLFSDYSHSSDILGLVIAWFAAPKKYNEIVLDILCVKNDPGYEE